MITKKNVETIMQMLSCDICGEIFEEAESVLFFTTPQKAGKKGQTFHICDPSQQFEWRNDSKELCIVKFLADRKYDDFTCSRMNFQKVFLVGD